MPFKPLPYDTQHCISWFTRMSRALSDMEWRLMKDNNPIYPEISEDLNATISHLLNLRVAFRKHLTKENYEQEFEDKHPSF